MNKPMTGHQKRLERESHVEVMASRRPNNKALERFRRKPYSFRKERDDSKAISESDQTDRGEDRTVEDGTVKGQT